MYSFPAMTPCNRFFGQRVRPCAAADEGRMANTLSGPAACCRFTSSWVATRALDLGAQRGTGAAAPAEFGSTPSAADSPSAGLRRRAMGDHRHQRASRASPTLTRDRRRPVPIHEGPGRWRHHVPAWRAARELAAAGGHLEPLTFPVSRSPSVHRGDPVTVNLHCGGLARLRPASPAARLPLRRAAPAAFSPYASAPWALARPARPGENPLPAFPPRSS